MLLSKSSGVPSTATDPYSSPLNQLAMYTQNFVPLDGFRFAPANFRSQTLTKGLSTSALTTQNVVSKILVLEDPNTSQENSLQISFKPRYSQSRISRLPLINDSCLEIPKISSNLASTQCEHSPANKTQALQNRNLYPQNLIPASYGRCVSQTNEDQEGIGVNSNIMSSSARPSHHEEDKKYHALQAQLANLAEQNVLYRGQLVNKTRECADAERNYSSAKAQLQTYKTLIPKYKSLIITLRQDCDTLFASREILRQDITVVKDDIAEHTQNLTDAFTMCETAIIVSQENAQGLASLKVAMAGHDSFEKWVTEIRQSLAEIVRTKQIKHDALNTHTSRVLEMLQMIQQHVSSSQADTEVIKATCAAIEPAQTSVRNELQATRRESLVDHNLQIGELAKLANDLKSLKLQIDHLHALETQNQVLSEKVKDAEARFKLLDQEIVMLKASSDSAISKALSETNIQREQNEKLHTMNQGLEEDIKKKSDQIIELRLEVESLKQISEAQVSQLTETEKAQRTFEVDMTALKQQHSDELATGQQKFDELNSSLIEALREKEDLKTKLREQETRVASKDNEVNKLRTQIGTLRGALKPSPSRVQLERLQIQPCVDTLNTAINHASNEVYKNTAEESRIDSVQARVQNPIQQAVIPGTHEVSEPGDMDDDDFSGLSQDVVLSMAPAVDRSQSQDILSNNTSQLSQLNHDSNSTKSQAKPSKDTLIPTTQTDADETNRSVSTFEKHPRLSSEELNSLFDELLNRPEVKGTDQRSSELQVTRHVSFMPESRPATANHEMLLRSSDVVDFATNPEVKSGMSMLAAARDHKAVERVLSSPSHTLAGNHPRLAVKREATDTNAGLGSVLKKIKSARSAIDVARKDISAIRAGASLPSRLTKGGKGRAAHGSKKHESHFGSDARKYS